MKRTPRHLLHTLGQVIAERRQAKGLTPEETGIAPVAQSLLERTGSLLGDDNLVGVGIAEKRSRDTATGELGLTFYVKRKATLGEIDAAKLVPPVLAGPRGRAVFTDVVEIGDLEPQQNIGGPPLRTGYSISHVDAGAGTLGAFVRKGGKTYCLSNAHVLALEGRAAIGDAIIFPGGGDGAGSPDACGTLAVFVPLVPGGAFVNSVDAALATIDANLLAGIDPGIHGAQLPLRVATPQLGRRIVTRGRSGIDVEAEILGVDLAAQLPYGLGPVGFTGLVVCESYSRRGDSGAIIVDKDSGAIVGLHLAGSATRSVFMPIKAVMAALGFTF